MVNYYYNPNPYVRITTSSGIELTPQEQDWVETTSVEEGMRMLRAIGFYAAQTGEIHEPIDQVTQAGYMEKDIRSTNGVLPHPGLQVAHGYRDFFELEHFKNAAKRLEHEYGIEGESV